MGSSRLRFLGGAFFGQQGESFYCTDAYTKTTHATGGGMGWVRAPRRRLNVAIVPARVGAYAYDMRWTSFLLWFAVQNDRRTRPHNGLREATGNVGESLESSSRGTSSERRTSRLHSTHPLGRTVPKKQEQQEVLHMLKPVTAV